MKMTKMALLAGAALAVATAGAQADDLEALKAQIESLNARVAAMETAPSIPAGYQLLTVSEGALEQTPGLGMTARERALYGSQATVIGVMPTADAPAGTTISWSGFARVGVMFKETSTDLKRVTTVGSSVGPVILNDATNDTNVAGTDPAEVSSDDVDVRARGGIRVKAATDTAVGEVGVDIRLRGDFNGSGNADVYSDVAWGYWAMTPELTLGGGYAGSLGNIGYGYDGACTCNYTDNADLALNPGDTTQLRLSYASGPVSFAVALEDGSTVKDTVHGDKLGAAGEIKYSGDMLSGEISGVWRDTDKSSTGADALWQVGAGLGIALGDTASLSLGGAMGEGGATTDLGSVGVLATAPTSVSVNGIKNTENWWGISALASVNMTDEIHAEVGVGYKVREGDDLSVSTGTVAWTSGGTEYKTLGILAGLYYNPVDQLTIGVEGEWYAAKTDLDLTSTSPAQKIELEKETETMSVNLVTVWRF